MGWVNQERLCRDDFWSGHSRMSHTLMKGVWEDGAWCSGEQQECHCCSHLFGVILTENNWNTFSWKLKIINHGFSLSERPLFITLFNLWSWFIKICMACLLSLSNHWHCIGEYICMTWLECQVVFGKWTQIKSPPVPGLSLSADCGNIRWWHSLYCIHTFRSPQKASCPQKSGQSLPLTHNATLAFLFSCSVVIRVWEVYGETFLNL